MHNPLRNLALNLQATRPATVTIVWIIGVVAVGIAGHGDLAGRALTILSFAGAIILAALLSNAVGGAGVEKSGVGENLRATTRAEHLPSR